jgi:hypothetical protein
MTHKAIKRFQMDGNINDDSDISRLREQYIKILTDQMRDEGYVRLLDLDPAWTIVYDHKTEHYSFLLTVHGVHYGKTKAAKLYGISNAREVPLS